MGVKPREQKERRSTNGSLNKLLENLSRGEPSDGDIKKVAESIQRKIAERPANDPLFDLGNDVIEEFVGSWTKALKRSLTLDAPDTRVLCGFGSVADTVYRLDGAEVRIFLEWAAKRLRSPSVDKLIEEAFQTAQNPTLMQDLTARDGKASDLRDCVALLFWCMQNKGKKPVLGKRIQREMLRYASWRGNQPAMKDSLGGASGNMCYVLSHLGLKVWAYWLYHHGALAEGSPLNLQRLIPRRGSKEELRARQKGVYVDQSNQVQDHPVRRSISFEFPQGLKVTDSIVAQKSGRVIYQVPVHRSPERPWRRLVLRLPASGGGVTELELDLKDIQDLFDRDGWPFLPLFADWRVEDDSLIVEVTDDEVMRQISSQIDYFILAGVHAIGFEFMQVPLYLRGARGPSLGNVVKHHLIRQLQVLADCGVVIHTEIPSMESEVFDQVGEIIRGRVRSISLNDDDLLRVTGQDKYQGTRFFYAALNKDENHASRHLTVFRRSQRAEHLAKELDVDQIYVHGNDVDLIRRKRSSRGALWREMEANLLAKAAVVLALMQRVDPASAVPLSPLLKTEGMLGFLQFAMDYAQSQHPLDSGKRGLLFKEILQSKLLFERNPEAYSTIVTPVFWPDQPPEVTTGAGDMTSSVVAIFSGN